MDNGSNGLGCVVIFASGNDNGGIQHPANSNEQILTAGAMSPCGERKNPNSCDGEDWGANYGSTLDVVAPGVLVPSTDRPGGAGYETGDYIQDFNGTSAAAPHIAGVAALVLSVNPDISAVEVNNIIEKTAQKVGNYNYSTSGGRPNGTWNNEMGYGLLNAQAAVQAANFKINGVSDFCPSTNFNITPTPGSNTSISWSVSPSSAGSFSSNASSVTFTRSGSFTGGATITANIVGNTSVNVNNTISISGPYIPADLRLRDPTTNNPVYFLCRDRPTSIKASHDSGAPVSDWQWNVSGAYITYNTGYSDNSRVTLRPYSTNVTVQIKALNGCGWSQWANVSPDIINCGAAFTVYPNPSTSVVYISESNVESNNINLVQKSEYENNSHIELELFDFSGNLVKSATDMLKPDTNINVADLKTGTYILRIIGRETEETHLIVVE